MKKISIKILLLLPLLAIVIGVNIWIDPLHLISSRYYEKAGLILEKNAIEYKDCDERKLMIEFLKHKQNTEIIILGSSRTAVIDSSYFKNSILNLSMSSAAPEDMIAVYGAYTQQHQSPKKVLFGIDSYTFNGARVRNAKGFFLMPYYNSMLAKMGMATKSEEGINLDIAYDRFLNVISFKYFQHAIISMWKNGVNTRNPIIGNTNKGTSLKDKNGVLFYPEGWQARTEDVDISVARDISNDELVGINGFTKISAERVELITTFIHYLTSQHVEVILLLTPYHPAMSDYIRSQPKYGIISESEKLIRQIAQKNHLTVVGSFDSGAYHLVSSDYYDAVHLKPVGFKKVFDKDYHANNFDLSSK